MYLGKRNEAKLDKLRKDAERFAAEQNPGWLKIEKRPRPEGIPDHSITRNEDSMGYLGLIDIITDEKRWNAYSADAKKLILELMQKREQEARELGFLTELMRRREYKMKREEKGE